jgi:hypothetical protein
MIGLSSSHSYQSHPSSDRFSSWDLSSTPVKLRCSLHQPCCVWASVSLSVTWSLHLTPASHTFLDVQPSSSMLRTCLSSRWWDISHVLHGPWTGHSPEPQIYIPVIQSGYPGTTDTIFSAPGAICRCNTNSFCSIEHVAATPTTGSFGVEPTPILFTKMSQEREWLMTWICRFQEWNCRKHADSNIWI